MSKLPDRYMCDIETCNREVPVLSTGRRDTISVHYRQTIGHSEDRKWTLNKPKLGLAEIDMCETHFEVYLNNLPLVSLHMDGYRDLISMEADDE